MKLEKIATEILRFNPVTKLRMNQGIDVWKGKKKIPAKVVLLGGHMINVSANGKKYTCHYVCGKWFISHEI